MSRKIDIVCVSGTREKLQMAAMIASVAAATGEKAKHIRDRGFDSQYYRDLIVALIRKHQPVSREDIDRLLLDKLPEVLTDEQKLSKIHNLLSSLSGKVIRNTGTRQASRGERVISLTAKEYELLELFLRHPRQVLTRDMIFDRVWGYDFGGESNIIEVYIRYLRQKLEASNEQRLIHTVRGMGYVLREAS